MPSPPRTDLVRMFPPSRPQLRAEDDGDGLGTLYGHFAVFNQETIIDSWWEGKFRETIAPGAFTKTIRENLPHIRVLFQHGMDSQVGEKVLGPVSILREEPYGPYYEVPLFDTSYNRDLAPGLRADQYGASFRFEVIKEDWEEPPEGSSQLPLRTIREIRLYEFGPVTFPAYQAASAGLRSVTDYQIWRSLDERGRVDFLRLLAQAQPGQGTPPGAAPAGIDEPGQPHSAVSPIAPYLDRGRLIHALLAKAAPDKELSS